MEETGNNVNFEYAAFKESLRWTLRQPEVNKYGLGVQGLS